MELRYFFVIILGVIAVIGLIVLCFIKLKKSEVYKGGKKVAENSYIENDVYFKKKVMKYKIFKLLTTILCIASVAMCFFIISGPHKVLEEDKSLYNRDIVLCLDVSASVDELNQRLVGEIKNTVKNLKGERFSVVIFNTTPVTLIPFTTDYEFVIKQLDVVEAALSDRIDYENESDFDIYQWAYMQNYIMEGTMVECEERGGSNIGDGLVAATLEFDNVEDDEKSKEEERTKIIIFATDNDVAGTPIFTLEEAATICINKDITVFGIGTEIMYDHNRKEMKALMEKTGGKFYLEENVDSFDKIVTDIEKTSKSLMTSETEIKEVELIQIPFIILLVLVSIMLVLLKITKR